jgi:hypothetical protein
MMTPHARIPLQLELVQVAGSLLAGLPPAIVAAYLLLRLLVPAVLIVAVSRDATPTQRISLVKVYLGFAPGPSRKKINQGPK